MSRKKRTPEENERREKIRELLKMSNVGSMEDIQKLFKETIAEFMEDGLEAEMDEELGYSKYDYRNKETDNSRNGHSSLKRNSRSCTGFYTLVPIKKVVRSVNRTTYVLSVEFFRSH